MTRPVRGVLPGFIVAAGLVIGAMTLLRAAGPGLTFIGNEGAVFSTVADLDGDGNQEVIISTIVAPPSDATQPPTPIYIYGVVNGTLVDRSTQFFGSKRPTSWYTRTLVTGDFNGDGQRDLFACNQGRMVSDLSLKTNPRTQGYYGEQSQVWFGENGTLVDRTSTLPQSVAFCHGASAGDLDHSGRDSIIMNTVGGVNAGDTGAYPPYPPTYILKWDGTQFAWSNPFPPGTGTNLGKPWGFSTATADFDKDGFADVVGSWAVLWGGAGGPQGRPLSASPIETDYPQYNGTVVADLNGDGFPDVVKINATKAGILGARFSLFLSDGHGGMFEKPDAFPSIATYGVEEFGADASAVDVNFDGFPDLVILGATYSDGGNYPPGTVLHKTPSAIWLNDGTGRFTLAHFTDDLVASSVCGGKGGFQRAYFLKTPDPKAFNFVAAVCPVGSTKMTFTSRTVTPAAPLILMP